MSKIVAAILIAIGLILVLDQLWLFGIPIGPFLPDLSGVDPTGLAWVHHWMLGLFMVVLGILLVRRK